MSRTISVQGANVRTCCAAARRYLGVALGKSRESIRSGGEDGLYRITLANGIVVEATIVPRSKTDVETEVSGG